MSSNRGHDATDAVASMVDLAFELEARGSAGAGADYRAPLADVLEARLSWLAGTPGAGAHRLKLLPGGGGQTLLARRTRLVLRVPRARLEAARALQGARVVLGTQAFELGAAQVRELLPWGTLYAHLVAADAAAAADEALFLGQVAQALQELGVACRPICGRLQVLAAAGLQGYGLMLDGLSGAHSLRVLEYGLGPHRRLGCGLFVPHKSSAAVGAPH